MKMRGDRVNKLLSIIIPAYNMEAYLHRALSSLVIPDSELFKLLDVIVVNDGSQDRTGDIAHYFANKYPDVMRVIDKQNGHYGSCVNVALPLANGVFVKILDADDSYCGEGLSMLLRLLMENVPSHKFDEVDLVLTNCVKVGLDDKTTSEDAVEVGKNRIMSLSEVPRHYVFHNVNVAWRTKMLHRIGYIQSEGIMYTDTEWMTYPLVHVRKLYYYPTTVYRYLIGREGQSMDPAVFRRCIGQRIQMFMRMMREAVKPGVSAAAKYRMQYVVRSGINALFLGDVGNSLALANERMSIVDSLIREYGDDVYNEFNYGLIAKWRKTRQLSACVVYLIRVEKMLDQYAVPVKKVVKRIVRRL